jgi:hypothetical protein
MILLGFIMSSSDSFGVHFTKKKKKNTLLGNSNFAYLLWGKNCGARLIVVIPNLRSLRVWQTRF